MDRSLRGQRVDGSQGSPPSKAWLFAQAVLGKPIPRIVSPETQVVAERRELERLAGFSTKHAEELRGLRAAESDARQQWQLREWCSQLSAERDRQDRRHSKEEASSHDSPRSAGQFAEWLREGTWDPSKHPRGGYPENRGWWSPAGGDSGGGFDSGRSGFGGGDQFAANPPEKKAAQGAAKAVFTRRDRFFRPVKQEAGPARLATACSA